MQNALVACSALVVLILVSSVVLVSQRQCEIPTVHTQFEVQSARPLSLGVVTATTTTTTRQPSATVVTKLYAPSCSEAQLQHISKNNWMSSNCPNHKWFNDFVASRADLASTLVTVGCNKGYDFVASMRAFSNNASYSCAHHARTGD